MTGAAGAYPRDLQGYGLRPPDPEWPRGARLAVQFVVNYEEGGEHSILHGDPHSEFRLHEVSGLPPLYGVRNLNVESFFEYGSRVGIWRIANEFEARKLNFTVFAVGMALDRNPEVGRTLAAAGHEIASHGWRWIDYQYVNPDVELDHIERATATIERITGQRPRGWYTGRVSPNTRRLVVASGGYVYDSDSYADDLPYWNLVGDNWHLIVPYSLDNNDMKFATPNGFATGNDFFEYLRDAFDVLYREGGRAPKMMSIGLHARLAGRPGRFEALRRFLDHVQNHDGVWVCRRIDVAQHWISRFPAPTGDRSRTGHDG